MNKLPNTKPKTSERDNYQFFNGLIKSVAGLIGVVILLLGVVLCLIFLPEISASLNSKTTQLAVDTPQPLADSEIELVDGKDVETGLLEGKGLELVKANCTACHSSALIVQNRFSREGWHTKIVWMQQTQGLWDLGRNEAIILDYLAENYAPQEFHGRRIPLSTIDWYELKD